MVEILPMNTRLPDISERESFRVEFSYNTTPPDANTTYEVKEFAITDYRKNSGVTVDGVIVSGEYRDSFSLADDSLKYITKDLIKKTAAGFDDLPDPTTADLYSFTAPSQLETEYFYKVVLTYVQKVSSSGGDSGSPKEGAGGTTQPPTITEHTIEKVYTQKVFGNWDVWAEQLRDYVKRGV